MQNFPIYNKDLFDQEAVDRWPGYGDGSAGDVVFDTNQTVGDVKARTIVVKSGCTLTPTGKMQPIILRATRSIVVENGAMIEASGYGMVHTDKDNNKFDLAASSWTQRGSIGCSGGGFTSPGGNCGQITPGGYAANRFVACNYWYYHYNEVLADGDLDAIPLFGGGGGGSGDSNVVNNVGEAYPSAGHGGGCIILCAPYVEVAGTLYARGQGGKGSGGYVGYGGGGGGTVMIVAQQYKYIAGADINVNGGGGGGYSAASWSKGGNSGTSPQRYSAGGGGGGSCGSNTPWCWGGVAGAGGSGSQLTGYGGSTTGNGGGGGNGTGNKRGTGGGAGGAAGVIGWVVPTLNGKGARNHVVPEDMQYNAGWKVESDSLKIEDGVISGFASPADSGGFTGWVLSRRFEPGQLPWEMVIKWNSGNDLSGESKENHTVVWTIYAYASTRLTAGVYFARRKSGGVQYYGSKSSSGNDLISGVGTHSIENNTWYWTKWVYDPEVGYTIYISTDGKNYEVDYSTTAKDAIVSSIFVLGACPIAGEGLDTGKIDLKESYIKVNGGILWQGKLEKPL